MTSINLGKMRIHFPELFLLKCNENVVFFSKTNQKKVKGPFYLNKVFFIMLCLVVVLIF